MSGYIKDIKKNSNILNNEFGSAARDSILQYQIDEDVARVIKAETTSDATSVYFQLWSGDGIEEHGAKLLSQAGPIVVNPIGNRVVEKIEIVEVPETVNSDAYKALRITFKGETATEPKYIYCDLSEIYDSIASNTQKIGSEKMRAEQIEAQLNNKILAEVERAKGVETELKGKINLIDSKIGTITGSLEAKIAEEKSRAIEEETILGREIARENSRALGVEQQLSDRVSQNYKTIAQEINRSTTKDDELLEAIEAEVSRATNAEYNLSKQISNEASRATGVESNLSNKISTEENRATKAEENLSNRISQNTQAISVEKDERIAADDTLESKIKENSAQINKISKDYLTHADKTNLEVQISKKQELISDLDTIRRGAALGATAVQPDTLNSYATKEELANEATVRAAVDLELNTRIDNVETRGRFLSTWNAVTGCPLTEPLIIPYAYKSGDYYIVEITGEKNYKPVGDSYTGVPSYSEETNPITPDDFYVYDGSRWVLLKNSQKTVTFSQIAGTPRSNAALKYEFETLETTKQDKLNAGSNIIINGATISAVDTTYTSGKGINIVGTVVNVDNTIAPRSEYVPEDPEFPEENCSGYTLNSEGLSVKHFPNITGEEDKATIINPGEITVGNVGESVTDYSILSGDGVEFGNIQSGHTFTVSSNSEGDIAKPIITLYDGAETKDIAIYDLVEKPWLQENYQQKLTAGVGIKLAGNQISAEVPTLVVTESQIISEDPEIFQLTPEQIAVIENAAIDTVILNMSAFGWGNWYYLKQQEVNNIIRLVAFSASDMYESSWDGNEVVYSKITHQAQWNRVKVAKCEWVQNKLNDKQDKLTEGSGIKITNNIISNAGVLSINSATGSISLPICEGSGYKSAVLNTYLPNSKSALGSSSFVTGESSNKVETVIPSISLDTPDGDIYSAWNANKFSLAKGRCSQVEGENNLALGNFSHAEGQETVALGLRAHAEGGRTRAFGIGSHAEGWDTEATGDYTHASGIGTRTFADYQTVVGKYNDVLSNALFIVGNGASESSRNNAFEVDLDGNGKFAKKITVGFDPENDLEVTTKRYVDNAMSNKQDKLIAGDNIVISGNSISANYSGATSISAGLMSAEDKTKLDSMRVDATRVDVSSTGTSTNIAKYITVNDIEYKLAGGGGGSSLQNTTITGDGTATDFTVTHNLNTRDVLVQVYDLSDYKTVLVDVTRDSNNTFVISFAEAPENGKQYKILYQA